MSAADQYRAWVEANGHLTAAASSVLDAWAEATGQTGATHDDVAAELGIGAN